MSAVRFCPRPPSFPFLSFLRLQPFLLYRISFGGRGTFFSAKVPKTIRSCRPLISCASRKNPVGRKSNSSVCLSAPSTRTVGFAPGIFSCDARKLPKSQKDKNQWYIEYSYSIYPCPLTTQSRHSHISEYVRAKACHSCTSI